MVSAAHRRRDATSARPALRPSPQCVATVHRASYALGAASGAAFLAKPFSGHALARAVRRVLAEE